MNKMSFNRRRGVLGFAFGLLACLGAAPSSAAEIAATNYGSSVVGMPWAVAMKKDFFKQAGADVSGVIGSPGGSTEVRNLIAGDLPYADSALVPTLKAIANGSDLVIVSDNTRSTAQFVWLTKAGSSIKSLQDLKGKRISFTTPLSTSQLLDNLLIDKASLKPGDVKLISIGAYGAALTALQNDAIDIALVSEPTYTLNMQGGFQPLFWSRDLFPAINSSIGVTSKKTAKERPELIRGIIKGRRMAVEYMKTNRDDSVKIIADVYKMDPEAVRSVLAQLMDHPSMDNAPFFGEGDIYAKDLDYLVEISRKSGDLKDKIEWRDHVDLSFLPDDLKGQIK